MAETIHHNPEFQAKKTAYFQNFIMRHLPQARVYKERGLLNEDGSEGWRNVAKHQLLSAVMTEAILELLEIPNDKSEWLTNLSLTHDVDKRRQQENLSKEEAIGYEAIKNEYPLVATSSNFRGFKDWDVYEYILRYVDSSVGEDPGQNSAGHWYGTRDPSNLPEIVILPWRQRLQMFKQNKVEEGENGVFLYGMTTWDKLEQIMTTIEDDLFQRIVESRPELAKRYTNPSQLTQLVEDRIHEKILAS